MGRTCIEVGHRISSLADGAPLLYRRKHTSACSADRQAPACPCLLEGTQLLLAGRIPQLVQRIVLDLLGGHSEMKVLAQ